MDSLLHSYSINLVLFAASLYIVVGPRLAALTFWYEFYYDVVCKGRFSWKIQELHQRYGPVVRINPQELHVADPAFYDSVYVGPGRRTEKWEYSARMFGTTMAAVGTTGHELHRIRRSALNGFFSKRAVTNIAPTIQELAHHGCDLVRRRGAEGRELNLRNFFFAFSADVVGQVAFGSNYGLLDKESFEPGWQKLMMDLSSGTHLMKQFPWAYHLLKTIPPGLVSLFHPPGTRLFNIRNDIKLKIEETRKTLDYEKVDEEKGIQHSTSSRTALHTLLTSSLPAPELQTPRLEDEAFTLLGAGTITTAHTLTTILYHVLANSTIKSRLEFELSSLESTFPPGTSRPSLADLEKLPYLQAITSEGLRLSFGVSHRLPRISPDTTLHYSGSFNDREYKYTIPPGVPISMTPMFMHLNPHNFPNPHTFDPSRWLSSRSSSNDAGEEEEELKRRKTYLVPFSKGTRACAGIWLAYAELYVMIGALFGEKGVGRRMELFETGAEDVECAHDFFNPSPRLDSKGLRVVLKEEKSK
ncbi:uncharacterized protein N0V89_003898 [Didymosphaeria variabile]|uniref:Cytochrome P450 n=1 Tax=Didymosphaeria variabile TaxID=1932322 RepID=A0A9W8XQ63_9PLEO|nr:uncharacterized protein N0V89_003898 [Didymosphaeria variabile]KAJ4355876.1 hypothetical protein N0V89_003898 [Didymosphaeria variabile]